MQKERTDDPGYSSLRRALYQAQYQNKQYLTVLDFIGNDYSRSVQIALALGTLGKTTYTEKAYLKILIE